MKKISIITPAYNCSKTIEKTIESIKSQTYTDFESIIVNDGSKDNSKEIIERAINGDNRFILINQENSGVSSARNKALDVATGDYICFVDSDDWLEDNYFENIINDFKENDIIIYSYNAISNNTSKTIGIDENVNSLNKQEFFEQLQSNKVFSPVWNKAFTKEIINGIIFNPKLSRAEDEDFAFECFKKTDKYLYINKSFYDYDLNAGTLGFSFNNNKFSDRVILYNKYEKYYKDNDWNLRYINNLFAKSYLLDFVNYNLQNGYNKKESSRYKETLDKVKKIDTKNLSLKFKIPMMIVNSSIYPLVYLMCKSIRTVDLIYKRQKLGKKY